MHRPLSKPHQLATPAWLRHMAGTTIAPATVAWLACGLVVLAAFGDWLTGADAAFTLLYVVPLALAVWFVGLRFGLAIAALSVAAGALCDIYRGGSHASWYFIVWNNSVEAALYLLFAQLLTAVRARVALEVKQRVEVVDQLRQSERLSSVGKLAAGVAQQISGPLLRISEQARALSLPAPGPARAHEGASQAARDIHVQADRISKVVQQLINFSQRTSAGVERADLKRVVDETLVILRPIAAQGGVEIVRTGGSVEAHVNSAEIQQVITNLVTNAIQAMPEGGRLEVTTDSTLTSMPGMSRAEPEPFARITVRDQGVGISPDVLPCVFDPFAQQDGMASRAPLGLSVSYDIVEEHGGFITVDTRLGEGTSFHVHLPS